MSVLSRRAALAASAAHPDAEVIRLAAEVLQRQAALVAAYEPPALTMEEERAREPEVERLSAMVAEAAEALAALAPRTLAGFAAKARAALALADDDGDGALEAHGIDDLLAVALVEDLARLGGPLPTIPDGAAG